MATSDVIANLQLAQSELASALATFLATPGPTITVGERTVNKTDYIRTLRQELLEVTRQLAMLQPCSVQSQVL
jgi:hypothetical protein